MIIREAQMQVLQAAAREKFLKRLMAHFIEVWPEQVKDLGDNYREVIERGVAKALNYDIAAEQCIARYLNLWFVWGVEFEDNPEFEWAKEILEDPSRPQHLKAHQLSWRTKKELEMHENSLKESRR